MDVVLYFVFYLTDTIRDIEHWAPSTTVSFLATLNQVLLYCNTKQSRLCNCLLSNSYTLEKVVFSVFYIQKVCGQ